MILQIFLFLLTALIPNKSYALSETTALIGAAAGGVAGATGGYFLANAITSETNPENVRHIEKLSADSLQELNNLSHEDLNNKTKVRNIVLKLSLVILCSALGGYLTYFLLHGYTPEGITQANEEARQQIQSMDAAIAAREADPHYYARQLYVMEQDTRRRQNIAAATSLVNSALTIAQMVRASRS
jgi:hypothetical protein